jgi:DASH complex subunit DAD1
VLTNLNRLNRSLEGVIAVGNEFGSVEALWSTFEGVMGDSAGGANSGSGAAGAETKEEGGSGGGGEEQTVRESLATVSLGEQDRPSVGG